MRYKICHEDVEYGYDELVVSGDTIEELREQAHYEANRRGWIGWWSEKLD